MSKIKQFSNGDIIFYCPGCGSLQRLTKAWSFNGDLEKPTINPSIKTSGYNEEEGIKYICHSFVRSGKIEFLSDCTHAFRNETVDLPDIEQYTNHGELG